MTAPAATGRNDALDATKGALVVCMVVYHSLNYSTEYYLGFRYLSFLPPSFIIIAGFLIAAVYAPRYRAGQCAAVTRRLLVRGVKLLALFTALNLAGQAAGRGPYAHGAGLKAFLVHWPQVYLIGSGRFASFEVLLPIAYFLMLAPALLWADRRNPSALTAFTFLLVAGCAAADAAGVLPVNAGLTSAGLVGVALGRIPVQRLNVAGRHWYLLLLAYAVFFPLSIARGWLYLVQLPGALLALAALYGTCLRFSRPGWLRRRITLLGRHSLLGYILQIALLQGLSRAFGRPDPGSPGWCLLFAATLILMTIAVEAVDFVRNRSNGAAVIYRAVFA